MPPLEFVMFRKAHSQDDRCTDTCWKFVEGLWATTISDLGGNVEIENEGSPHLSWSHDKNGKSVLGWMVYPGSGTGGDFPRFEVHFDSVRKQMPTEVTERMTRAADELSRLVSRNYLKLQNKKRWTLHLEELGASDAVRISVRALAIFAS